jgi:gamma-glutamyltranspeptidase/glutathione hydrolase
VVATPDEQAAASNVMEARANDTRARSGQADHAIVVANDTRATEIGLDVLRSGGSAADAFVATCLAETVLFAGVTSIAGYMHALYYDAKAHRTTYVVGPHRRPKDPSGQYGGAKDPIGRAVAIPGGVFGFAELARRFGRKPLQELTRPAAKLARDGFSVDSQILGEIWGGAALAHSEYGRRTYHPAGYPLLLGDVLRLPAYAETLDHLGRDGPKYFSSGDWARRFVRTVNEEGGVVSMEDLAAAGAIVLPPIEWRRRNVEFVLGSGPSIGGAARLIFAFSVLDGLAKPATPFSPEWVKAQLGAYTKTLQSEGWLGSRDLLQHASDLAQVVAAKADEALHTASASTVPLPQTDAPESGHSSAVVVVDSEGNIAVGMHSLNEKPFGGGIFVGGVPLATSIRLYPPGEPAGTAIRVPFSPLLAMRDGRPVLALAQFGVGFMADVQIASAVLDGDLDVVAAATGPRLVAGYRAAGQGIFVVDPRYSRETLCQLASDLGSLGIIESSAKAVLNHAGVVDAVTIGLGTAMSPKLRGVAAEGSLGRVLGY